MKQLGKLAWLSGPVLIVLAASLWGVDGIIRRSLFNLPPITIVFYEHLIGTLLLFPWIIKHLLHERVTWRSLSLLGLVSLVSGLLGTLWFTTALLKTNFIAFSVVFLLQQLEPIFAIATAHIVLKEKLTKPYVLWAAVALVAAYFVTFQNGMVNFETGSGTVIAALYALGAAVAWGVGTTISKLILQKQSDVLATGLRFCLTTILAFGAVWVLGAQPTLMQPTVSQLSRLVLIALSTGMVAMLLYYKGLKQVQAKYSALLEMAFPLLAIGIDVVIYRVFLAPTQYLAAIILMVAIYQVGRLARHDKPSANPTAA